MSCDRLHSFGAVIQRFNGPHGQCEDTYVGEIVDRRVVEVVPINDAVSYNMVVALRSA